MKVKSESEVAQLCPTIQDPMDSSLPGSSAQGIFQARVLEQGAIAFSNKNLEEIKKSQSIMNNAITEIKSTLEETNSRITEVQDRISEVEDRTVEINEAEREKEKRILKKEDNLRDLWDNVKCPNIWLIGAPEGEDRKKGHEKILEIIVENFPKMGKEIATQIQETQKVPNRMNPRWNTPRHILIKLTKIKHKEQTLKAAREKQQITQRGSP